MTNAPAAPRNYERPRRTKPTRTNIKIRARDRNDASPGDGMRQSWTEYQIVAGHRIVGRFDTWAQAEAERALILAERGEAV